MGKAAGKRRVKQLRIPLLNGARYFVTKRAKIVSACRRPVGESSEMERLATGLAAGFIAPTAQCGIAAEASAGANNKEQRKKMKNINI